MGDENQRLIKSEEEKCSLRDLLMDPKRMATGNSTCSNIKLMRSSFSLDELSTSFSSASVKYNESKLQDNLTSNNQSVTLKTEKKSNASKVNFGDISSLI